MNSIMVINEPIDMLKTASRVRKEFKTIEEQFQRATPLQKMAIFAQLPTLVDAAPGSGKTWTVTQRIKKAFEIDKLKPENILVLTFTKKAAGNLTKQTQKNCNQTPGRMGTFHGVMHKFNSDKPELIEAHGYKDGYIAPSAADNGRLIRELIKERADRLCDLAVKEAVKFAKDGISELKSKGYYPKDFHMAPQTVFVENISSLTCKFKKLPDDVAFEVFEQYQIRMMEMNALDYDDLISLGAFALRDEVLRKKVIKELKLVIVDEFQDTSEIQLELVRHLSDDYANLFAVGDVDQTLYEWRNASVSQYMHFYEKVAQEVRFLTHNFRSTPNIINLNNAVIVDNRKRTTKTVQAVRKAGKPVVSIRPWDHNEEAKYIVGEITRKIKAGVSPSEIAILYRSRKYPTFIEKELINRLVDYHIVKGQKFFDRLEVKSVFAYLRLATNFNDDLAFQQVFNYPKRRNGERFLKEVKARAYFNKCSYFTAMQYHMAKLSPANKEFVHIVETLSTDVNNAVIPATVIQRLSDMLNLPENLILEHGPDEGIERHEALHMLATMLDQTLLEFETYQEALTELNIAEEADFEKTDANKVQLMTVHTAKGLEFEHVYVVGAVDGIMPSINAAKTLDPDEDDDRYAQSNLEEERRIFYVAISRAKDELTISSPHYIYRNGKSSAYDRSMFLDGKDRFLSIKKVN